MKSIHVYIPIFPGSSCLLFRSYWVSVVFKNRYTQEELGCLCDLRFTVMEWEPQVFIEKITHEWQQRVSINCQRKGELIVCFDYFLWTARSKSFVTGIHQNIVELSNPHELIPVLKVPCLEKFLAKGQNHSTQVHSTFELSIQYLDVCRLNP